jgi:pyridoxal phosphate enzyme (YggS family)
MAEYETAAERIALIKEKISAAAHRSGRKPDEVKILAVTKFHPETAVRAAYGAGIRLFGENRVQEAERKYTEALRADLPDFELHMIGNLQSNKINKAMTLFDSIQSVSSLELLESLVMKAAPKTQEKAPPLALYLELHTAEDSKSGFPDAKALFSAMEAYERILEEQKENIGVRIVGLMTMAPFTADERSIRASFSRLRLLFEELRQRFSLPGFEELSMGMSGDYQIAVEEGSTLVRIGTAIFGDRL